VYRNWETPATENFPAGTLILKLLFVETVSCFGWDSILFWLRQYLALVEIWSDFIDLVSSAYWITVQWCKIQGCSYDGGGSPPPAPIPPFRKRGVGMHQSGGIKSRETHNLWLNFEWLTLQQETIENVGLLG
jgi:hypothetical protein